MQVVPHMSTHLGSHVEVQKTSEPVCWTGSLEGEERRDVQERSQEVCAPDTPNYPSPCVVCAVSVQFGQFLGRFVWAVNFGPETCSRKAQKTIRPAVWRA